MVMEPNDPCSCGSGKKFKKCCLVKDEAEAVMQRAEEQKQAEDRRQAEAAVENIRSAAAEHARASAPVENRDDKFAGDNAARAAIKLGWSALSAESQRLVDAWWDEVNVVYMARGELKQVGWLLERTVAFLDEHPQLFRYLHLHEEFLLEIGPKLDRAGRKSDHCALLLRLRSEQPEVYSRCFGYWDLDLLAESLRAGRREGIPACLALFRQKPIRFIEEFAQVVDLLAWQGCETELRGLLEPTAAAIEDSAELVDGGFGMRWLTNLAMFPFLELGDDSPGAIKSLCQQVMAVGYLRDDAANREWLRRGMQMALPTETEAGLDLKQAHSARFDGDVAWSFAGWLRRTKDIGWASARFLAEAMLNYWYWAENAKKGGKASGKKGGKTKVVASFGLDAGTLRDYLDDYCRDFFGIRSVTVLSTIQAFHYFTQYLVARGHLAGALASGLQTAAKGEFERIVNWLDDSNPAYRIYPTYERLIPELSLHLEP